MKKVYPCGRQSSGEGIKQLLAVANNYPKGTKKKPLPNGIVHKPSNQY